MSIYLANSGVSSNINSAYKVENGKTITIGSAYRVSDGKTSEIFSSGLPDNVLYDNGLEKNKLSGGLKFTPTYTWLNSASTYYKWLDNNCGSDTTSYYSRVIKNKLVNSIQLGIIHTINVYSPSSDKTKLYCSIVTNNKINLSGYTKVNINYTTESWLNNNSSAKDWAYFDIYCNESTNNGENSYNMRMQQMGTEGNNLKDSGTNVATINIPNNALNKTCYLYVALRVRIYSTGSSSTFKFKINKIWLE